MDAQPAYHDFFPYLPPEGRTRHTQEADEALQEFADAGYNRKSAGLCDAPCCLVHMMHDPDAMRVFLTAAFDAVGYDIQQLVATQARQVPYTPARREYHRRTTSRRRAPTPGRGDGSGSGASVCSCARCARSCSCTGSYATAFGSSYDYSGSGSSVYSEVDSGGEYVPPPPARANPRRGEAAASATAEADSAASGTGDGGVSASGEVPNGDGAPPSYAEANQSVDYRGATPEEVHAVFAELVKLVQVTDVHGLRYLLLAGCTFFLRMNVLLVRGCCRSVCGGETQTQTVAMFARMVSVQVQNAEVMANKPDTVRTTLRWVSENAITAYMDGNVADMLALVCLSANDSQTDVHTMSAPNPIYPWPVNPATATLATYSARELATMSDVSKAALPDTIDYTGTVVAGATSL